MGFFYRVISIINLTTNCNKGHEYILFIPASIEKKKIRAAVVAVTEEAEDVDAAAANKKSQIISTGKN